MIEFVCDVADPVGVTSPHSSNARGRIKLAPEVATAYGIKPGSRGKSTVDSARKGKESSSSTAAKLPKCTRVAIRNRGESTTSF